MSKLEFSPLVILRLANRYPVIGECLQLWERGALTWEEALAKALVCTIDDVNDYVDRLENKIQATEFALACAREHNNTNEDTATPTARKKTNVRAVFYPKDWECFGPIYAHEIGKEACLVTEKESEATVFPSEDAARAAVQKIPVDYYRQQVADSHYQAIYEEIT